MRKLILVLALLLACTAAFGQDANNQALGGKVNEGKTTPSIKKSVPKPASNQDKPSYSPCGVYYKNRRDMIGPSNLSDNWFSMGESASKHFWHNPHKTNCDTKSGVLKTWIKEEHKNTGGDFALVLYELKCRASQLRVKTVIEYDKAGAVLETNDRGEDTWQDVAPGTAGEVMLRTACRRP